MTLSERFQELRRARRLSCAKLSAALGCHPRTVENWMYYGNRPRDDVLQRLADFFFSEVVADQRLAELYRGVEECRQTSNTQVKGGLPAPTPSGFPGEPNCCLPDG